MATLIQKKPTESLVLGHVPSKKSNSELLNIIQTRSINWRYVLNLKKISETNDEIISNWLNVSVKTFRSYKLKSDYKLSLKEHIYLLYKLFQHGIQVFGAVKEFNQWLNTKNFYFDDKNPNEYLSTVTGIGFIDDRLTGMEYGDNV